jgi:ankyrin repeat protein
MASISSANDLLRAAAALDDADECVRLAVEDGADVNACNENGTTALHIAARAGSARLVDALLSLAADVHAEELPAFGQATPLTAAADAGHFEIADALADAGADVNHRSPLDASAPLHRAAARGDALLVKLLLSYGADARLRDAAGRNASHYALANGHRDILMIAAMPPPSAPAAEEIVAHAQFMRAQHQALLGPKAKTAAPVKTDKKKK